MKTILFFLLFVCASSAIFAQTRKTPPPPSKEPEVTTAAIRQFLNGKTMKEIPVEGASEMEWTFEPNELKEIDIIETTKTAKNVVVVVQLKTGSEPGVVVKDENGEPTAQIVEGRVRLTFEYIAGEWTLLKLENLTVKGREVPVRVS